jgi:hypothetical protein
MNTKKITQIFIIALAMMFMLTIGSSMAFGQRQSTDGLGNALVGVWESVAPAGVDCQTGEPIGSTIRALYTFNQGGTMSEENTDPIEGPYRTTGHGIWKRTSGRDYTAVYTHYSFDPDTRALAYIIKVRTNITLQSFDPDSNSFTEKGTFEVTDPSGKVVFAGCFADTAHRLRF